MVFLVTRLAIRIRLAGNLAADDALVLAAWVMLLANACLWAVLYREMFLTVRLSAELARGQWPAVTKADFDSMHRYLRAQLATYFLGYTALWSVKLSFLFYFRNLGARIRSQTVIWWLALVFVVLSWGVIIGVLEYRCLMSSGLGILSK